MQCVKSERRISCNVTFYQLNLPLYNVVFYALFISTLCANYSRWSLQQLMHYGRFWHLLSDTNANTTLARHAFALFIQSEDDKQNQQR